MDAKVSGNRRCVNCSWPCHGCLCFHCVRAMVAAAALAEALHRLIAWATR